MGKEVFKIKTDSTIETISEIISKLAHDYNNILAGIDGYTDLILRENNNTQTKEDLLAIKEITQKMANLNKDLLYFSRRKKAEFEEINLNKILNNEINKIKEKYSDLKIKIETLDINMKASETQMSLLFKTLLENSTESKKENLNISIKIYKENNKIFIEFIDNALGIKKENLNKIFLPFFTTKQGQKGLGLSILYGIVKRLDGEIVVESEENIGTKFIISF